MDAGAGDIVSVDFEARLVMFEDGKTVEISRMIDAFGDDCDEAKDAVVLVVGPMPDGTWTILERPQGPPATVH